MNKIVTLVENNPSRNRSLWHEHGFSCLVQWGEKRFLFDCGAGETLEHNAYQLGIALDHLDGVVLSHSHYDHAAGYRVLIESGNGSELLYTGPHFFEPKYAEKGLSYTNLSAGFDQEFIRKNEIIHRVADGVCCIADGLYLVSGFERFYQQEKIPKRFVKMVQDGNKNGENVRFEPDLFEDEICMVMDTDKGLVILAGCSHPGICNMVRKIRREFQKPVYAVFGGTHLVEAEEEQIMETIHMLKENGLQVLGLSHCSGEQAERAAEKQALVCHLSAGDTLFFAAADKM